MSAPATRVDKGLPVRLSARRSDSDYDPRAEQLSDRIDVIVDGQVLDHATSWDVVKGRVTRHRRDAQGRLILEAGAPTFETLSGAVEVRWSREGGAA